MPFEYVIEVSNLRVSRDFYERLGFLQRESMQRIGGRDALYMIRNSQYAVYLIPAENPQPTTTAARTTDLAEIYEEFKAAGAEVEPPARNTDNILTMTILDPDRNVLVAWEDPNFGAED